MAEQLAENLYYLDIPLVGSPLKNLNSYLILGERSLLIDTGFRQESCRVALERELDELGVNRDTMDIFITHLHSDHSGLAPDLIRPGCAMYMGQIDLAFMRKHATSEGWKALAELDRKEGFSQEEVAYFWGEDTAESGEPRSYDGFEGVVDGQVLTYGGLALQCVETPGHTPGHMCLYDAQNKRLFTGDHVLFHITPNICRWAGVEDSLGQYLHGLAKVSLLDVEEMHTGHRHDRGTFQERIAQLQAHHQDRLADTLQAVEAYPGRCAYDLAGKLRWSIRAKNWAEFPVAQKFFAVGETLAHLDYLACRGQVHSTWNGTHHVWHVGKE